MGAFVLSEYIETWFKKFPNTHRTDQRGTRIICPKRNGLGYPAELLHERPNKTGRCQLCHAHLGHVKDIPDRDHPGEFQWPTVAV